MAEPDEAAIRAAVTALAQARGTRASFCPSEVARQLADDWRPLMPRVRAAAAGMEAIETLQKGAPVDPLRASGPIRLRLRD